MILKFATKRNTNGNRKYLAIDTDRKEYATDPHGIMWRDELIEVSAHDLATIRGTVETEYKRIDAI